MTKVVFGVGGSCSTGGSTTTGVTTLDGIEVDLSGAQDGDVLVYNAATNRIEPLAQTGNPTQEAFNNDVIEALGEPNTQLT